MSLVTVRPARPGDGPGCAAAWQDAGRYYAGLGIGLQEPAGDGLAEWFEHGLRAASSDAELLLVAEVDGRVAGFLSAVLQPARDDARWQLQSDLAHRRLHVDALMVAEVHRRSGVGTALMAAAEEWGRAGGAAVVITETNLASPMSVPFYEDRMGYTRQAVTFRKSLT